ncbi:Retrotransposon gag protein [Gossypium australe]|uniref:Retrotransposon gag protein n=1 Tax=Gossypium australe TaxID=47621 RepID=A0A5B6WPI6_9ROSI|nr:Retrotransposon gag protein [Gossypium australe]
MPMKDLHLHLRLFIKVSDSFKLAEVTEDVLRLKLFPYSLRDIARAWLNSLSLESMEDESMYKAWKRFKELLGKCPHQGIPYYIQLESFYNGLNAYMRMVVDASANGALLSKSYKEAYKIMERIATRPSNTYLQPRSNQPLRFPQQVQKPPQVEPFNRLENLLMAYIAKNDATLRNLESQVGKLAIVLQNRPQGALSSDTENRRVSDKEHCKVVTLRSRKTL